MNLNNTDDFPKRMISRLKDLRLVLLVGHYVNGDLVWFEILNMPKHKDEV